MSKPSFFGTFVQTPRIGDGLILVLVTGLLRPAVTARFPFAGSLCWPPCVRVTGVTGVTGILVIHVTCVQVHASAPMCALRVIVKKPVTPVTPVTFRFNSCRFGWLKTRHQPVTNASLGSN